MACCNASLLFAASSFRTSATEGAKASCVRETLATSESADEAWPAPVDARATGEEAAEEAAAEEAAAEEAAAEEAVAEETSRAESLLRASAREKSTLNIWWSGGGGGSRGLGRGR